MCFGVMLRPREAGQPRGASAVARTQHVLAGQTQRDLWASFILNPLHWNFPAHVLRNAGLGGLKGVTFKRFLWPDGRVKQDFPSL